MFQETQTFPQFSHFPREIQLLVWEHSLPAPRVLEAALFDNPLSNEFEDPDEESEIVNLRLTGSLSKVLGLNSIVRIVEDRPVEHCPSPITLQICRLSRWCTLTTYKIMDSLAGSFYYSPQRDIVFLSVDVVDDYPAHMPSLQRCHGEDIGLIENVMIFASEWPVEPRGRDGRERGGDYTLDFLGTFSGLRCVFLLWRDDEEEVEEEDEDMEEIGELEVEGRDEDEMDEDEDEEDEEEVVSGPQQVAKTVRDELRAILEFEKCTARSIVVIDREGLVY